MSNVFFTADTHFGHAKVLQFEATVRNFATIEEHDEELIRRWNDRVRPKDIVWHLGDVFLGKQAYDFHRAIDRLNGKKYLIRGNHDTLSTGDYLAKFDEVYGVWPKYGFVMSHVPLHPDNVDRWGLNVHGHLHSQNVPPLHPMYWMDLDGIKKFPEKDGRYYCVSVEQHNLAPISLDEIRKQTDHLDKPYIVQGGI